MLWVKVFLSEFIFYHYYKYKLWNKTNIYFSFSGNIKAKTKYEISFINKKRETKMIGKF